MKKEFKVEGIESNNPNNYGGMVSRAVTLDNAKEIDFEKGIDTIATTENPALVVDWERWQIIREVLPMKYSEMPANDKVPFLDSHDRSELEKVKGSARNWAVDGKNLVAKVFISKSETDLRQKIQEGHIDSVSIGYMTDKNFSVEIPKKTTVTIDGVAYRNDFEDNYPYIIRTWWKTKELSGVAIGADELAKFKSAGDMNTSKMLDKINELQKQIDEVKSAKTEVTKSNKDKSLLERRLRLNKNKTKI